MIIWENGIIEPFQKWKLEVLFQLFLRNKGSDLITKVLISIYLRLKISLLAFPEPSAPA